MSEKLYNYTFRWRHGLYATGIETQIGSDLAGASYRAFRAICQRHGFYSVRHIWGALVGCSAAQPAGGIKEKEHGT